MHKLRKNLLLLVVIATILTGPFSATARANTYYVCPRIWTDYVDSGLAGEDFWTSAGYQNIRGVKMTVFNPDGSVAWPTNYASSNGCSGAFTGTPGIYTVEIYSQGKINNTELCVGDSSSFGSNDGVCPGSFSACNSEHQSAQFQLQQSGAWAVNFYVGANGWTRRFNTYEAMSWALWLHDYTANGQLKVKIEDPVQANPFNTMYHGNDCLTISQGRWDDKFVITHELGHFIADFVNNFPSANSNCWKHDEECPESSDSHSMLSKEWQQTSFAEGFAHFYWVQLIPVSASGAHRGS